MAHSDKTEAPTAKRKRDARKKGQIARSQDLVTWTQILVATFVVQSSFALAAASLNSTMTQVRSLIIAPDVHRSIALFGSAIIGGLVSIAPLALGMAAVTVVSSVAQTGLAFSTHKLKPSLQKVSPAKGVKRLLSKQGAWEATKELVRALVLAYVAWQPLTKVTGHLVNQHAPLRTTVSIVAGSCIHLARNVAYAGIALALADYVVQKRRLLKSMKMTKQEVKDEHRQSEGDPQMKGKRRQRQMEMSRNRMMTDVKTATTVVVNPTHVAVALRYERFSGAPKVVAKGTGAIATRIRVEAEQHQIPIVRDVVLARALNVVCEVGQEIPADLYEAVARLLAFVMSVGRKARWAGPLTMTGPSFVPRDLAAQVLADAADSKNGARRAAARYSHGRQRPSTQADAPSASHITSSGVS